MWPRFLLFAGVLAATWSTHASQQPTLRMGMIAAEVPATMVQRAEPLAKYLAARTGINIVLHPGPSHGAVVNDLGRNVTQIAYLTPVSYIMARERHGVVPVAIPLSQDGKPTFHLVVAVRKDSPARSLQDVRSKKLALGDRQAFMQPAMLYHAGVVLKDFSAIAYVKHHDNVAKAVLNGDFDAGILPQSHAARYPDLRIVHMSPPIPNYSIAARSDLPQQQLALIREALLGLNARLPQDRAILQALDPGYTGFAPVDDQQFDSARKLMEPLTAKAVAGQS